MGKAVRVIYNHSRQGIIINGERHWDAHWDEYTVGDGIKEITDCSGDGGSTSVRVVRSDGTYSIVYNAVEVFYEK